MRLKSKSEKRETRTLWREKQQLKVAREIMAGKRDSMGRKLRPEVTK